MSEKLKRAGDVIIGEIILTSSNGMQLDVAPQVVSIEITENLFEPFTSGVLTIVDGQNLSNLFPLVGNEFVSVSFHTPTVGDDQYYYKKFFIYAISDKIKLTERTSGYQLRVISIEAATDRTTRVSRTFRGHPDEIVSNIVRLNGLMTSTPLIVEPALNDLVFISNMWKPTKCIDYVCRHAINANNSPTYLFFEQRNRFIFATLEYLSGWDPIQAFAVNNWTKQAAVDSANTSTAIDIAKDYQTVKQIQYSTGFNHFKRIDSGYYGSETIGVDITTQQYIHIRNKSDFSKEKHLNKYSPIPHTVPVDSSAFIHYVPFVTQNFEGQNQGIVDTDFEYRGIRQQLISRLQATHLTIKVWGRSDYTVGSTIDLSIPKDQQITKKDDPEDKLLSGKYLITSLKHVVTPTEHNCNIQIMKDSFMSDINYSLLATKANTGKTDIIAS